MWLILGYGISGKGVEDLLIKEKKEFLIYDDREIKNTKEEILMHLRELEGCIISPGISQNHPMVKLLEQEKIPLISELDFGLKNYHGQVISVTGTNGKSTVCNMCYHLLLSKKKEASLGGNIGTSICKLAALEKLHPFLVLEVSSYQLERTKKIKPKVAIFYSFSKDHQERHLSIKNYFLSKWSLFLSTPKNCLKIISRKVYRLARFYKLLKNSNDFFILDTEDKSFDFFLGPEKENSLLSLLAVSNILKTPIEILSKDLETYTPLPYRRQSLGTFLNVHIINDSKSTNVDSVLYALKNLGSKAIVLLGGKGKGESFKPVLDFRDRIEAVLCFGADGPIIAEETRDLVPTKVWPTLKALCADLKGILENAQVPTLLFSPGCASFDEFLNFEDRGHFFSKKVSEL